LIVALEIAVVPLALGLPVVALIFSIANVALLLSHRERGAGLGGAADVSATGRNPCQ
jgi:hypothetical protein